MSFKNPEFLYALFAILIPILIHLFNFRRYKKLWFSNIEFLKNITVQTRKQNKLKHLLVLLSRILAIVFLVLAFAGPQWKDQVTDESTSVLTAVYVDNSYSMMAEGENGRLFDQAKNLTREIFRQAPRDARFILLSNQGSYVNRLSTREEILSGIDDIEISSKLRLLSSAVNAAARACEEKDYTSMDLYLLSDFQKYSSDTENLAPDTSSAYFLLPLRHIQRRNIFVDSCWTDQPVILPGKPVPFTVRISNASDTDVEKIPLKVSLNGQQKAVAGVDIAAQGFIDKTITLTPTTSGWQRGLIEIEDYPITFDDKYYFSFEVNKSIRVLEISGDESNNVLKQFYDSDSVFSYEKVNYRQVNYNRLNDFNLVVLNSLPAISTGLSTQIRKYVTQGGNVIFVPSADNELTGVNGFLQSMQSGRITTLDTSYSRVVRIKQENELFKEAVEDLPENANLPDIQKHYRYSYAVNSGLESLISLLNGDDLLLSKNYGNGRLYLMAVSLISDFGNFPTHPLFVPVMYGAALGSGSAGQLAFTIGKDEYFETYLRGDASSEKPYSLINTESGFSFIPEQRLIRGNLMINVHKALENAGYFELVLNDSVYHEFSFNYNREESSLYFLGKDELETGFQNAGIINFQVLDTDQTSASEIIDTMQKESELWKLFIIFALLMLLAEVLILRLWK
jgi:hypothetical protein